MPYVYKEELAEGETAADVRTAEEYAELQELYESAIEERDIFSEEVDNLNTANETLKSELVSAKEKFADAFLSSRQKQSEPKPQKETYKPKSFTDLFKGGK